MTKLLKQKDKNNLTPFDLLQTFKSTFDISNNKIHAIHGDGTYDFNCKAQDTMQSSSSLIISLSSGDYTDVNLQENLFPPVSVNPLLSPKIAKFVSCATHSALITLSGRLYLSNPQPTLFNSSFCRINFFDELYEDGEKVVDVTLTPGHTIVLTSENRTFAFGNNIKRLNLYQQITTSSSQSTSYSKDFGLLVPLTVSVKARSSSVAPPSSSSSSAALFANNFSALSGVSSGNTDDSYSTNKFLGVTASNNHTVIYSKSSLHIHGLNLGQFGPLNNATFDSPSSSSSSGSITSSSVHFNWKYEDDPIYQVLALDLATLVITKSSLIHIYVAGLHVKIPLPLNKDVSWNKFKPSVLSMPKKIVKLVAPVSTDRLGSAKSGSLHSNYSLLALLDSGEVYVFAFPKYSPSKEAFKDSIKFTLIWNPSRLEMRAQDISIGPIENNNTTGIGAVLCTKSGEAFKRTKAKWTRINDVSKITNVAIGYGFPIIGNFSYSDDNPFKTILLRQEDHLLKHEIGQSETLIDFAKLSPIIGYFTRAVYNNRKFESMDYLVDVNSQNRENSELESDYVESAISVTKDIVFHAGLPPLVFRSKDLDDIPYFDPQSEDVVIEESMIEDSEVGNFNTRINISMDNYTDYEITVIDGRTGFQAVYPVHKDFIFARMSIKKTPHIVERKDFKIEFNESDALINGDIDTRGVALFLHYLYTDEMLQYTLVYTPEREVTDAREIKEARDRMLLACKVENLSRTIESFFTREDTGDITIKLADGEVKTWKYFLCCRCDYFRQYFSGHWHQQDSLDFTHVSKYTWNLVMRYLAGDYTETAHTKDLFYETVNELVDNNIKKINEKKLIKKKANAFTLKDTTENSLNTPDDFVNVVLELLYFSNELLLPNLRQLCELVIKDLINFSNYDIFLQHAFISGSNQLFSNCAWFIFNNLYLCYNDQRLNVGNIGEDCAAALDVKIHELLCIYIPNRDTSTEIDHDTNIFINNIDDFNGYYLHQLLWDEHGILEVDEALTHNPMTRRKSQTITKMNRSNSIVLQQQEILANLASRSSSNESAISDDTDNDQTDGFVVVQNGRRKSSSTATLLSTSASGRLYSSTLLSRPLIDTLTRRDSSGTINPISIKPTNEPWKIIRKGSTSSENLIDPQPPLQPQHVTGSSLDEIFTQSRTNSKVDLKMKSKITAPTRISQKERKQRERDATEKDPKGKSIDNGKAPWVPTNAWGMNAPRVVDADPVVFSAASSIMTLPLQGSSSSIVHAELNTATLLAPNKMNTVNFPSLEELKKSNKSTKVKNNVLDEGSSSAPLLLASSVSNNSTSSLEIPKSFEEIKAEEEFEKWWREESERVQRSMKVNEGTSTPTRGGGNRGGRGGNRGRGNGNRGGSSNRGSGNRGRGRGNKGGGNGPKKNGDVPV